MYRTGWYNMSRQRIYRTRSVTRWMDRVRLTDRDVVRAVGEMAAGLIDADLGGGLLKKRVPLPGRGKRGGARMAVMVDGCGRWLVLFGYAKTERSDLDHEEWAGLRALGVSLFALDEAGWNLAAKRGILTEVNGEQEEDSEQGL